MARRRLPVTWRAFHLPKRGNTAEEYEDAVAANPDGGRFGIADGASESSFAGLWARLLVEGFSNGDAKGPSHGGWLQDLQQRWSSAVDSLSLPWYAEMKRDEGAFATFLGLSLRQRGRGRGTWHALAAGDSCLFQIRADRLTAAFPVFRSEDFGTRPCLLGSRPQTRQDGRQFRLRRRGRWLAGDRFLLMTDALAQWFLQQTEEGEKPWLTMEQFVRAEPGADANEDRGPRLEHRKTTGAPSSILDSLSSPSHFADWIECLRDQGDLKNDDVTLLVLPM